MCNVISGIKKWKETFIYRDVRGIALLETEQLLLVCFISPWVYEVHGLGWPSIV